MKPQLIKFSCPACKARLAVPVAMAGMQDNCPKCGSVVSAPVPAAEQPSEPVAPPPEQAAPTAPAVTPMRSVLEAVVRQHAVPIAPPKPAEEPSLFDDFLSGPAPEPTKQEPPSIQAPASPAPGIPSAHEPPPQPQPLFPSAPTVASVEEPVVARPPEPPPPDEQATEEKPSPVEIREPHVAEPAPEAKSTEPPAEAVEDFLKESPQEVSPTEKPAAGAEFGLGHMLEQESSSQALQVSRQVAPPLGVGLLHMPDSPRVTRLRRRRSIALAGIITFVVFDVILVTWIFRHRISEWWHDRGTNPSAESAKSTAKTEPPKKQPLAEEEPPRPSGDLRVAKQTPPPAPDNKTPEPPKPELKESTPTENPPAPPSASVEPPKSSAPNLASLLTGPGVGAGAPPITSITNPPPLSQPLISMNSPSVPTVIPLPGSASSTGPTTKEPAPEKNPKQEPPASTPPDEKPPEKEKPKEKPDNEPPTKPDEKAAMRDSAETTKNPAPEVPPPPQPPPLPTGPGLSEVVAMNKSGGDALLPEIPKSTPPPLQKASDIKTTAKPDAAAQSAQQVLRKFLAAPDWRERQRWSQRSQSLGSTMEKYYQSHPDGAVDVAQIEFIDRYPKSKDHPPYSMFEISGGSLKQTVLVLVEEATGGQPRVDWETFVEFKDRLLWQFLLKPSAAPQKFRVQMRRKHTFDKSIPDIENKDSFELTLPGSDAASLVYASRDGSASKVLSQQLAWGSMLPVTVELQWRSEGIKKWVEIKSLVAFGWRS